MTKLVSLVILLHLIGAGILLERRVDFFRTRTVAMVFVYMFAAHVAFGMVLVAFPGLIDPR